MMSPGRPGEGRRVEGGDLWRRARQALAWRLAERRDEIEEDLLARVHAVPGTDGLDQEYAEGLRGAVHAALEFGLEGIACRDPMALPIPMAVRAQARLAARNDVDLEIVLNRCVAGYTVLEGFLFEEIGNSGPIAGGDLKQLSEAQTILFERLSQAVRSEYRQESSRRPASTERRHVEVARRLLDGKFVDTSDLAYEFDSFHVAAIARGTGAGNALKGLASALDCRLFLVPRDEATVWAWFGSRKRHDLRATRPVITQRWPSQIALSLGEAEPGLSGWRRSHRQADAAFGIALRKPGTFVRYGDDPLLASCMQDDLLRRSLHEFYLAPLADERDGGALHRETLRAYFAANRIGASAAHALDVTRQTVTNRLQAIEALIGRPLTECGAELEVALRLEELGDLAPVAG
jgi:hypothetical protein